MARNDKREFDMLLRARVLLSEVLAQPEWVETKELLTPDDVPTLVSEKRSWTNARLADVEGILARQVNYRRLSDNPEDPSQEDLDGLLRVREAFGSDGFDGLRNRSRAVVVSRISVSWIYLDLVYRWAVLEPEQHPTILYISFIFDKDTEFDRERHGDGVGYHYHLKNGDGHRTDVALTFCQDPADCCPLIWYRHAEKDKRVTANPDRWRVDRRLSITERCLRDAKHLKSEFVRPPQEGLWIVSDPECPKEYKHK